MLCFDMVVRFLRASGYQVTFVRNITDIDDKIIKKAQALNLLFKPLPRNIFKRCEKTFKL